MRQGGRPKRAVAPRPWDASPCRPPAHGARQDTPLLRHNKRDSCMHTPCPIACTRLHTFSLECMYVAKCVIDMCVQEVARDRAGYKSCRGGRRIPAVQMDIRTSDRAASVHAGPGERKVAAFLLQIHARATPRRRHGQVPAPPAQVTRLPHAHGAREPVGRVQADITLSVGQASRSVVRQGPVRPERRRREASAVRRARSVRTRRSSDEADRESMICVAALPWEVLGG
ncbi:hypothetical protein FA95DRAFT_529742 [Auriscalpium vulgare]|uniref:Uncharacterized protein n=1 Tax=Auriscalpium vulgare TaxID=40419 RepID=A0ACB8S2Q3_9AGAM|nr:hypothetical protein FA95DRAFT_529742 [Auriscalpium vulgare]